MISRVKCAAFRRARLIRQRSDQSDFILAISRISLLGGKDELSNLRTLCSTCNQGAENITSEKPSAIWLLSQVRRAARDEQQAVYEWLKSKFEHGNKAFTTDAANAVSAPKP